MINGEVFESNFEIALDHLPSILLEKNIRDVKIIEKDTQIYVLVLYNNGVLVLLDFNEEIKEDAAAHDETSEIGSRLFSLIFVACMFLYVAFGRNYFFRRRIIL